MKAHTSAADLPGCFTTAHTYSVPLESVSVVTSSTATPFFLQKPCRALLGLPSGLYATCRACHLQDVMEVNKQWGSQEGQGRMKDPTAWYGGGGGAQVANKAEGVGRQVGARPCSVWGSRSSGRGS